MPFLTLVPGSAGGGAAGVDSPVSAGRRAGPRVTGATHRRWDSPALRLVSLQEPDGESPLIDL